MMMLNFLADPDVDLCEWTTTTKTTTTSTNMVATKATTTSTKDVAMDVANGESRGALPRAALVLLAL
eukprot:CAMPEP_0203944242 /NCGR_PEP_ID=MMETSP0359-20131031/80038_1 /ASSEMBLY_ACC=CAM_ASM_000338 /TAXON_ID=268821 /ORGANISM="Scrippsiella Hangoei, Strain SHTV-5" /LENGTH=66 /DNA_ID=CAMNT_0050875227 /DNA_START=48 /DNA_END=244 /DNA_ORIENTATION=+